jgi:sodium-coupled monocarboxylate transporter 8/12
LKDDQILPYFVVTQLPAGLPGLLIAAIYAASMSTISAGLNSLATATVVDFQEQMPGQQRRAASLGNARWITTAYGALVMVLAFAVSQMKGNLVESVNTVIGLIGGPLLGLFFMGMFTQRATSRGALTGTILGFGAMLALFGYQNGWFTAAKPVQVVSFIWFSLLGCGVTMLIGLVTSRGVTGALAPSPR